MLLNSPCDYKRRFSLAINKQIHQPWARSGTRPKSAVKFVNRRQSEIDCLFSDVRPKVVHPNFGIPRFDLVSASDISQNNNSGARIWSAAQLTGPHTPLSRARRLGSGKAVPKPTTSLRSSSCAQSFPAGVALSTAILSSTRRRSAAIRFQLKNHGSYGKFDMTLARASGEKK